jgi:ABC-type amino acid transport substrate-binding protein
MQLTKLNLFAALATCLLNACGGSGGGGGSSQTQPLPDLQGQVVTVAVEVSAPPFSYVDLGGLGSGWDYDTVNEICRRLNCVAQFQQTRFQGVFDAVHAGQFDMLADGVTITAQRQQLVAFSTPYLTTSEVLLVRANEAESLAQFRLDPTKSVGAQAGTTNEQTAINTFGAARVLTAPTEPEVVSALQTGTVDGAVLDNVAANVFILGNPGQLKTLGVLASGEQLAFAFPPNSSLVDPVNAALQSMMNDGTLTALNIKWRVVSQPG